ncbi:class I SAM-dependent methyltransferase [Streptomyces sp. AJS327]|uniref:class I SAM-dependent methyltransferase n=1 Tax=Streptomyces sp. AJS327 TaxID=2545265 RepID=UPI0017FB7CC2|nr:methyltransferase domain-containing protein [Streptomyces sp. AJS327]MBA0053183.1 class I SAM-dependent methyltransferase [Streptomyces sp. AJS327]
MRARTTWARARLRAPPPEERPMTDVVNVAQAQAWNSHEGAHWAHHQDRWNAVNEGFDEPLLDASGIVVDHSVLDLGCGSGQTTRRAALRAPRGRLLGLDISATMLAEARARTRLEGVTHAAFFQGDAQVYPLPPASFDRAISRFGVMFFDDPVAAFDNVRQALRPGGRLAFVCPAEPHLNDWVTAVTSLSEVLPVDDFATPGQPGMFSLTSPDLIHRTLTEAGFTDITVNQTQAHGTWGDDPTDAAEFLLGTGPGLHLLSRVDPATQARALTALTDHLRGHVAADGTVRLRGSAWLVTADRPATSPGGT